METDTIAPRESRYLDTWGEPTLERWSRGHFFTDGAKRFFRSRIGAGYRMMARDGGTDARYCYFATSERFVDSRGGSPGRYGSVRVLDCQTGSVDTVGKFQDHASIGSAARTARRMAVEYQDTLPPSPEAAR